MSAPNEPDRVLQACEGFARNRRLATCIATLETHLAPHLPAEFVTGGKEGEDA